MRGRASVVVVALGLTAATGSALGAGNLLTNGTFEGSGSGSLSGWKGRNATLSLVTGDGGGFGARVTRTGTTATYAIVATSAFVKSATAGKTYAANGRFKAPSTKQVCLKISETGTTTSSAQSCASGSGANTWATLPELRYTAKSNGDKLQFLVLQLKAATGDTFTVDNLSVAQASAAIDPPSNLNATAVSTGEIDLAWTASGTAGITGYHVFRNGNSNPTATVNAPATTYADTGLTAGTTYRYTVTAFDSTGDSDPSNEATATTQGGGGSVVVAAAGDIACNPADPDYNGGAGQNGSCQQGATAGLIANGSYDRVLALGDEQYDCGSLGAFNTSYDASWGRFVGKTLPVPGNHEAKTTSAFAESGCSSQQTGYFTYYANHGVSEAAGVNGKGYYSVDVGSWHIVAINSNCTTLGGCDVGSPQETWLRNDLAAHSGQCTLAMWHEAAWSTTSTTKGATKMRPIWADLVDAGVDLAIAGHFHHYERFDDLTASGQPAASGNGTRQIIAGIGGVGQGGFGSNTPAPGSQVRKTGFGVLALTLSSGQYSWQYIQVGGALADSGVESCH
jgi:hypothetical protein